MSGGNKRGWRHENEHMLDAKPFLAVLRGPHGSRHQAVLQWDADGYLVQPSPNGPEMIANHMVIEAWRPLPVYRLPAPVRRGPPPPPVAGSAILMDCEGCWTHSIPIEDCDGDNCPRCGLSMLMEQGDQFDAAVWGGGYNRAYVPNAEGESRAASARTLHPLGSSGVSE